MAFGSGVNVVRPVVKDYAWGSVSAIPRLLGVEPTGVRQAELWLGAHASSPSLLLNGVPLDQHVTRSRPVDGRYAGQLPFLMKLLAAESPLSIQVHPDRAQAIEGFEREEGLGLGRDDAARNYKDPHHKPEILVAVTRFSALCGLREPRRSAGLLRDLWGSDTPGSVAESLLTLLDTGDLRGAIALLLSGDPGVRQLARRMGMIAESVEGPLGETIRFTASHYGDDPGVVVATLMNRVDLEPGEAIFLDAGQLHAYLRGLGVEAMAPSDNVLRGGLTPKHVDVAELQRVVVFEATSPVMVPAEHTVIPGGVVMSYRPPADEFEVHRVIVKDGSMPLSFDGPGLVIVTAGTLSIDNEEQRMDLRRGTCAFVEAGSRLLVQGRGEAYLTTSPTLSVR